MKDTATGNESETLAPECRLLIVKKQFIGKIKFANLTPKFMQADFTSLLKQSQSGNQDALNELFPVVYDELRRLAANRLKDERCDHTLQPTALVHEAYLRLIEQNVQTWHNRVQFFGLAAVMMRRILINHAVKRNAQKRFGDQTVLHLDEIADFADRRNINLLLLDDALNELQKIDPRQVQIIELKFFAGLISDEIAEVLGISESTVKREWRVAKAWLHRELNRDQK